MRVPTFDQTLFEYCNNPTAWQINKTLQVLSKIMTILSRVTLADANSAQTVLYFFLLMLYKASTCKIFLLCAVVLLI